MGNDCYNFYSPNEKILRKLKELNLPVTENPDEKNTIICYPIREEGKWTGYKTYPYDLGKYAILFKNNELKHSVYRLAQKYKEKII